MKWFGLVKWFGLSGLVFFLQEQSLDISKALHWFIPAQNLVLLFYLLLDYNPTCVLETKGFSTSCN